MSNTDNRMTPEAREALLAQMKQTSETASVSNASQSNVSATASMRERMEASKSVSSGKEVVLEQGVNYNPNPQPDHQNHGSSTTIINTTQIPQDNTGDNDDSGRGFKPTKTFVLIAAGIVVFGVIMCLVFLFNGSDTPKDSGTETGMIPEEDLEWITPDSNYLYTQDQIEELRTVGYTGTEIENFQSLQMDVTELVKEAKAKRDAWVQEAVAPLYDATSQEYKDYIAQTWLTLPKRNDTDEWDNVAGYYEVRKNLDYEKVTSYGNQLFLKVFLDDNVHADWFFLNVTPEDWNKLKERGNVIVNYTYCTRYVGTDEFTQFEDYENIFITAAYLEIIE